MAWRNEPADMEYSDDDLLDRMAGTSEEPPSYPPNLRFTINEADLEKAAGETGGVGKAMRFAAMAEVTSVHASTDGNRVELRLTQFAGDDGKFVDLDCHGHISFCDFELDRLDLDCDCELGDTIHLIGEARLESIHRSEFAEMATLQVTKLTYVEDESDEGRDQE